MKATFLILACFVAIAAASTAFALTTEREMTLNYVQEHPDEFSVSATKAKDGLINFTVTHNVTMPMYHVAHLAIYHDSKLIATSDTPSFGKKRDNKFYFSIAPDNVAQSRFSLSDSPLDSSGEVPIPGTIIYQFRLSDFVPKELMNK